MIDEADRDGDGLINEVGGFHGGVGRLISYG